MRGISPVVWIVVVIIVMLVVALVVLSIFGGGVTQVASFADASTVCIAQYTATCAATGVEPATWEAKTMRVGETLYACSELAGCTCDKPTRKATCAPTPK